MISQMNALAEQGMLANFVGMLTDSRSFLSYQRHDYFRRILATYLGNGLKKGKSQKIIKPLVRWLKTSLTTTLFAILIKTVSIEKRSLLNK